MKLVVPSVQVRAISKLGPECIACGNTQRFWIQSADGEDLVDASDLPAGQVQITACGRCRSRNSVVIAHLD